MKKNSLKEGDRREPVLGDEVDFDTLHPLKRALNARFYKHSSSKMYSFTFRCLLKDQPKVLDGLKIYLKDFMMNCESIRECTFVVEKKPWVHLHGFFYSRKFIHVSEHSSFGWRMYITPMTNCGWVNYVTKMTPNQVLYCFDKIWQKELKDYFLLESKQKL